MIEQRGECKPAAYSLTEPLLFVPSVPPLAKQQAQGWLAMIGHNVIKKIGEAERPPIDVQALYDTDHVGAIAEIVRDALQMNVMNWQNGTCLYTTKWFMTSLAFCIEKGGDEGHYHAHINVTFKNHIPGSQFKRFLAQCNCHMRDVHFQPMKHSIQANLYIAKGVHGDPCKQACSVAADHAFEEMNDAGWLPGASFHAAWDEVRQSPGQVVGTFVGQPYGEDLHGFFLEGCTGFKNVQVDFIDLESAIEEDKVTFPILRQGGTEGSGGARDGAGRPSQMDEIYSNVWSFVESQVKEHEEPDYGLIEAQALDMLGRRYNKWGYVADSAVKSMVKSAQRTHAEEVEAGNIENPLTNGLYYLDFGITDDNGKLIVADAFKAAFDPNGRTNLRCMIEVVGEPGSGKTHWVQEVIEGELGQSAMRDKSLVNGNAFQNTDFPGTDFRESQKVIIFSELEAHKVTLQFKNFCATLDINGASLNQKNRADGVQSKAFLHFWVNLMPLTVTLALWVQKNGKVSLQDQQQLLRRVTATLYLKKDCACASQGRFTCSCAPSKHWLSPLKMDASGALQAGDDWLQHVKRAELTKWGFDDNGLFNPPAMVDGFNPGNQ